MKQNLIFSAMLGMTFIVGCEKEAATPAPSTPAANTVTNTTIQNAADAASAKASEVAANLTAQAQKLLDEVTLYIKDKKMDLAEESVKKLEAMKASLPAEWASKIESARKAFDSAKAALGAMPAMPAMPK